MMVLLLQQTFVEFYVVQLKIYSALFLLSFKIIFCFTKYKTIALWEIHSR